MRIAVLFLALCILPFGGAQAQQGVPDHRYIANRDMDFPGRDLQALFDTDLASCRRACDASPSCVGFTFNMRSNACFPKSALGEAVPYAGAISAAKVGTPPDVIARAESRVSALNLLTSADLANAADLARGVGMTFPAGSNTPEALIEAARAAEAAGDRDRALGLTGAAVSLTDRADLWTDFARIALSIDTSARRDRLRDQALGAAINGYLRAPGPGGQASALVILARALERAGRGRDTIPALRLAHSVQSRADISDALDRAIAQFGFRITDSRVESDSAAPRICAEFSEPLARAGVDYDAFVQRQVSGLSVTVEDSSLCVEGVTHGERYGLTFREGLPSAEGETLARDTELRHYVRDRSPSLRFPGRAYVLPRAADAALPIQTVNLSELDLVLRRVSDRNLVRAVQDGFFARPLSHWQEQQFDADVAQEVWRGTGTVQSELNREMLTRLPMGAAIADQPPGIYALTAKIPGADPYDDPGATQWFVLSDLGLSTLQGTDGLHVTVRGLSDAAPREGVALTLVSRANAVLGEAVTDSEGRARFDPGLARGTGGAAPALMLARDGGGDLGFLSLTDPAFDLSDRGVAGREAPGPVDVFLATDRGAYRAGEVIHATALARDAKARAIEGLPLTAILSRPDGVEYRRSVSDGGVAGGHVFSFPVGAGVPRGTWRLEIFTDPEAPALASQPLLVEDFLPERIDFTQTLPEGMVRLGDSPPLRIEARYLFGAPGADLEIEGSATLRAADTLADWPGYRFGRFDAEGQPARVGFGGSRTDANGQAVMPLDLPAPAIEGKPMELLVTTRLADGSARPVERRMTVPVAPPGPVIGIKPLFEDVVAEGSEARFEVIALSPDLATMQMQVEWTLNRIETRYQWYQLYGNWNWEPTTRRTRIATGTAQLGQEPISLSHPVDWGHYELLIERQDGAYAAAALDFFAGWYQPEAASDTPDRLEMSLDAESYAPGDTARLRIVSRWDGEALVSVLSNRVIARKAVAVKAGETLTPLEVTADWGTGAYVTVQAIRPMDVPSGQNPARALGVAHARVAPMGKELDVAIEVPETVRPRQTQTARLRVSGMDAGENAYLTLAAVDLGILNLTGFDAPDPKAHYFGQRRLGVELRDVYGRLIDGMNGAMGAVRSGGDADAGLRMQSPPPTQDLVAVFSGPVTVGADGRAEVEIPLPAFNGTVRLMAVAWSRDRIGQASRDMTVRDPVVVTASVPRSLAPGDESRLRLEVVHADGPSGGMELRLAADPGLTLGADPGRFDLTEGGRALFEVPVSAVAVGDPEIALTLTTPDGTTLDQVLRLPVRSNDPTTSRTRRFSLAEGDTFTLTTDVFAGLRPGTGRAMVSAGPLARFDAPGLLTALDRYPYGCTEQVTSAALPLLYLSSVAQAAGLGDGPEVRVRVDQAIARVLTRQAPNGAFGMWRAQSGEFWLDAYVTDFLSRARAQEFAVPDRAMTQALDNLRNRVNYAPDFDHGGEDLAYALMVLAREGAAAMGDLRYYADVKAGDFATPLAVAQLGAALAAYGDQTRADRLFTRAAGMLAARPDDPTVWRVDFGTELRDTAAVLALATEAGSRVLDSDTLTARLGRPAGQLSTQEAAWTLMAARALVARPEASGLRVDGDPVEGPFVHVLDRDTDAPLALTSTTGATDITLTTLGVPLVAPEAGGNGYALERQFYGMDGVPLEGDRLRVGERFVTVLRIRPFEPFEARLILDDPLPAGVEIDNPALLRSGDVAALDWLEVDEAETAEFRSDRFIAAVDARGASPITLAYVARAVTPGDYHHPAAKVEDMYRPRFSAHTGTGRVQIGE